MVPHEYIIVAIAARRASPELTNLYRRYIASRVAGELEFIEDSLFSPFPGSIILPANCRIIPFDVLSNIGIGTRPSCIYLGSIGVAEGKGARRARTLNCTAILKKKNKDRRIKERSKSNARQFLRFDEM